MTDRPLAVIARPDRSLRSAVAGGRAQLSEPLYRGAYSLMASTLITSGVGVVFWIVAARLYAPEIVGRDSALITAMIALSTVAQLNLAASAIRFLPTFGRWISRLLATSYALTSAVAVLLGVAFVLLVPDLIDELRFLRDADVALVFLLGITVWGIFAIQDAALTAVRRAHWVPLENAAYALLKLAALPLVVAASGHGILVAWVVPLLVVVPLMSWLLFRRAIPPHVAAHGQLPSPREQLRHMRLGRFLAQDYTASVLSQVLATILPLLVIALVGDRANAYFYVAVTLVSTFDLLFLNATMSFTVEAALDGGRVAEMVRALVRRPFVPLALACGLLMLAAPLILLPFGGDYAREAVPLLRVLACASLFRAALDLYIALCRLRGQGRQIVLLHLGALILLPGLCVLLTPSLGAMGVALAWLVTHVALAAAAAPTLVETLSGRPPTGLAS